MNELFRCVAGLAVGLQLLCTCSGAAPATPANTAAVSPADAIKGYVEGLEGERRDAGRFLLEYMPEADRGSIPLELFRENLEQAFIARETYPWTKALPRDLFFNDVLPYALVDETRDPWRLRLRELYAPQLAGCQSVRDVSEVVGGQIAKLTGVRYDTKREKACQSPAESMKQGMASCTGLSILMVDSLRACGVPTRLAGIPLWGTLEGNHTWLEIHDGEAWQMADFGSAPKEWNKGWAIERCAYCDPQRPIYGVFASSFRLTRIEFPLIWDWNEGGSNGAPTSPEDYYTQERDKDGNLVSLKWTQQKTRVSGEDRTAHYIELAGGRKMPVPKGMASVALRAFLTGSETRVDVAVRAKSGDQIVFEGRTASEAQDRNDFVRIICPPGELVVEHRLASGDWSSQTVKTAADKESSVKIEVTREAAGGVFDIDQRRALATWFHSGGAAWPAECKWPVPADAAQVDKMRDELWSIFREAARQNRCTKEFGPLPPTLAEAIAARAGKGGLAPQTLTLGKDTMPFVLIRKETTPLPASGRALYICLHGGGNNDESPGPHAWDVNTQEWQSQARLAAEVYAGEGIFFVPRMADDRRGRWWFSHNQNAFDMLVGHAIREWNVDPDRVYLMGISEGAYGTQIDGPFMADRFAAANAMAGGVGKDVPAENLRNLPFRTDVGEKDTMFDRIGLAREFHSRMEEAKKKYGGYQNHLEVQAGRGHGVDYAPGSQWMIHYHRNPRPDTVVWKAQPLDNRRREAFYWLGLEASPDDKTPVLVTARLDREHNSVVLDLADADGNPLAGRKASVMLDDSMLDLTKPVTVLCNGKPAFSGVPVRSVETLARTMLQRSDPHMCFPVRIEVGSL
ncbi:MAG: transglutaminase domain-containing protein [Luteolibacter sp.]